jgi:hypothetical protein
MAKEDFCFTYYDGDALRDMSHMNRLERGCYNDIVLQQRKFGRLTIDQIKKILGKDFEECWPSVNLVLIFEGDKYFIEWLEKSILKMRANAKHQSENGKKGGRKKAKSNPNGSQLSPNQNPTSTESKPLEDGDGNEDVKKNKKVKAKKNEVVIPFTSEAFLSTWNKWRSYRKEINKPYRSILSEQTALDKIRGHPEEVAIEMIENSIANQWQGIFELKNNGSNTRKITKNDRAEFNANELAIIQQHASGTH